MRSRARAGHDRALGLVVGHIPCTCYGPYGERIHGIDEWVSLSSLHEVTAVLALFIARWCGVNRLAG
jgi:acetylornithine deacetylase